MTKTHRMTKTRIYRIWQKMKERCENPNSISYRFYGAKGVAVCERWQSFENFYADVGEPPFEGATLDRPRPEEGYGPTNFQWLTRAENASRARHRGLKGTENGRAKLTDEQVREILSSPLGCYKLAKQYGVSKKLILNIRHVKAWAHLGVADSTKEMRPGTMAKITDEQRREIAISSETARALAERYGITPERVYQLRQQYRNLG